MERSIDLNGNVIVKLYENGSLTLTENNILDKESVQYLFTDEKEARPVGDNNSKGTTRYTWCIGTETFNYRLIGATTAAMAAVIAAHINAPIGACFGYAASAYYAANEFSRDVDEVFFKITHYITQVTIDGSYTYYIHDQYARSYADRHYNNLLASDHITYESTNIMP